MVCFLVTSVLRFALLPYYQRFMKFEESLTSMKFETLVENGCKKRKNHEVLQFLLVYVRMVKKLLNFIQASRSRNCLLHLKSAEEMMLNFSSIHRIKYRRMWSVYIVDMYDLQYRAPDVWAVFMPGDFSCQKSNIPGTAIGRDHAGEQENKIIKSRGGITGITRNENSRTRHFLAAPVFSSISEEMMEIGGANISKASSKYHQLSPSYSERQNENISALVNALDAYVSFNSETVQLQNMITRQKKYLRVSLQLSSWIIIFLMNLLRKECSQKVRKVFLT